MSRLKPSLLQSDWWLGLTQRERILVGTGSIIVIATLVYILIWSPLSTRVATLQTEDITQRHLLYSIKQMPAQLGKQTTIKSVPPENLLTLLDESLNQQQLKTYVQQFQQAADNSVDLQFKSVPFDDLINWLTWLWQNYSVKVTRFTLTPPPTPGLVNVNVTVQT